MYNIKQKEGWVVDTLIQNVIFLDLQKFLEIDFIVERTYS